MGAATHLGGQQGRMAWSTARQRGLLLRPRPTDGQGQGRAVGGHRGPEVLPEGAGGFLPAEAGFIAIVRGLLGDDLERRVLQSVERMIGRTTARPTGAAANIGEKPCPLALAPAPALPGDNGDPRGDGSATPAAPPPSLAAIPARLAPRDRRKASMSRSDLRCT